MEIKLPSIPIRNPELDELVESGGRIATVLAIGAAGAYTAKKLAEEGASRSERAIPVVTAVTYLGTGAVAAWNRLAGNEQ